MTGASKVTEREAEAIRFVAVGMSDDQIARRLGISRRSLQRRLARASVRLGASNRASLVWAAARAGVLDADIESREGDPARREDG